jgi:hypothetical protein
MKHRKTNHSWIISILSILFVVACSTDVIGQPKDWTVTWTDNSDNEEAFILYQYDESLATPAWVELAVLPPNTEIAVIEADATKGATFGLSARNTAGESGRAEHTIDPIYIRIPAMPGFLDFKPN